MSSKEEKERASERSKAWQAAHPGRVRENVRKGRERKIARQNEIIEDLAQSAYKTPISAIMAYCRLSCKEQGSWCRRPGSKSYCHCENRECPLYAYRNGDGRRIEEGRKRNNIKRVTREGAE